jgi:EpsD family peptidyl-prolyl cis-trans isomerase
MTMKKLIYPAILLGMLSGCDNKASVDNHTQVIAKVNGDEITVHQVNAELQRIQMPVSNPKALSRKVLESLIDRQLLVQEAIKLNLDHTPEVVELVAAARAQIYAQAYLVRKVSSIPPAKEDEVRKFMLEHPEVFSARKVLSTTDVVFNNDPSKIDYDTLQTKVSNLEELKSLLVSYQIHFDMLQEQIPSESMPKQALSMLNQIKVGDLLFMHDDNNKVIVRSVNSIIDAPLENGQSMVMAAKIVNERKRQQFINDELSRLKKLAKIDRADGFLKHGPANQAETSSVTNATHHDGLKGL